MQSIEAYKSVTGKLFEDEVECANYDLDCIGMELDALLLIGMRASNGNVTRNDQHRMCLELLNSRSEVEKIIKTLNEYFNHAD